ncbi:MAG TPA: rod shape-determining protein MreC, partial [Patescibacteria group bacterium]
ENTIIIDKGASDNVKMGGVVIYKNNLLGKVVQVESHLSVVNLITQKDTSFTAQSSKTSATGVIYSGSGELILDKVVLSDALEKDDLVVTKGDIDSTGSGFPPGLVVGKIVSVSKRASALFQAAEVRSLTDFSQLRIVFVIL